MACSKSQYYDAIKKNIFYFVLKSLFYDAREYWKKNMYLRRRLGKIIQLWYPKNTDSLKSPYYDADKYWKNHVFKPWPSQNHTTMIPNKCIFFIFWLKSHYSDARKYWCLKILKNKHVLLRRDRTHLCFHSTKIDS